MSSSSEQHPDGQPKATAQTNQRFGEAGQAGLDTSSKSDGLQQGYTGVGSSKQVSSVKPGHQRLVFTDPVAFRSGSHLHAKHYICRP